MQIVLINDRLRALSVSWKSRILFLIFDPYAFEIYRFLKMQPTT